jgi:hypothetical protein
METLTKENFWNEMEQKYPKAMAHFQNWIDEYKVANDWEYLFNANWNKEPFSNYIGGPEVTVASKYHELPIAMQFGIFLEYVSASANSIRKKDMHLRLSLKVTGDYTSTIMLKIQYWFKIRERKL